MSDYFIGRRQIDDPFDIGVSGHKMVRCTIFQRWVEKERYECACGLSIPVKVTKTRGISETDSESLESSIGSKIGVKDVAELQSKIKAISGHEIQWTYTKAEEMSFTCDAPACGCKKVTVNQLVQDYDLVVYVRGYLFKRKVWDIDWARTLTEELGAYSATQDVLEYDERCKGCKQKTSPEFDGRLSLDIGTLSLLVPYKMTQENLDVRIGKYGLRFPVLDYGDTIMAFQSGTGIAITLESRFVDPALQFLAGLTGTRYAGKARIYQDEVTRRPDLAESVAKEIRLDFLKEMGSKGLDVSLENQ